MTVWPSVNGYRYSASRTVMRKEVKQELLKKKNLRGDVKNISTLRHAQRSRGSTTLWYDNSELAHASVEALKEIWLKVVHRFA
jgi:hypothetical protein